MKDSNERTVKHLVSLSVVFSHCSTNQLLSHQRRLWTAATSATRKVTYTQVLLNYQQSTALTLLRAERERDRNPIPRNGSHMIQSSVRVSNAVHIQTSRVAHVKTTSWVGHVVVTLFSWACRQSGLEVRVPQRGWASQPPVAQSNLCLLTVLQSVPSDCASICALDCA